MKKILQFLSLAMLAVTSSALALNIENNSPVSMQVYDSQTGGTFYIQQNESNSIPEGGTLYFTAGNAKAELEPYQYQGKSNIEIDDISQYSSSQALQQELNQAVGGNNRPVGPLPGPAGAYNPSAPAAGTQNNPVGLVELIVHNDSPHTGYVISNGIVTKIEGWTTKSLNAEPGAYVVILYDGQGQPSKQDIIRGNLNNPNIAKYQLPANQFVAGKNHATVRYRKDQLPLLKEANFDLAQWVTFNGKQQGHLAPQHQHLLG